MVVCDEKKTCIIIVMYVSLPLVRDMSCMISVN